MSNSSFKLTLTDEEKDWLKKEAGATGLSMSLLVKKLVFSHRDGSYVLQNPVTGGMRDMCRKTHNLVQALRLLSEKTEDEVVRKALLVAAAEGQVVFQELLALVKRD